MTAKHCVNGVSASSVKVIAGITCKNEINSSNTFSVSRIILHPDPNIDVALLQLSSNITFNNNRNAIYCYPSDNSLYNVGRSARVSGWGWLTPDGYDPANCLQAVDVNIISNQAASTALGKTLGAHEMATTGVGTIRQGACHADSGGPLTTMVGSTPVLIGVVCWGRERCEGNNATSPSVYLRVSHIMNWIASNVFTNVVYPGSSETFTVYSSSPITWTRSNNLVLTVNGNTATVRNNASLNSSQNNFCAFSTGWIRASINGTNLFFEKSLTTNRVCVTDFNLPATASNTNPFQIIVTAQTSDPANVTWSVSPNNGGVIWNDLGSSRVNIGFSRNGTYTVTASTQNACGTYSRSKNITISGINCIGCPPPQLYTPPPPSGDGEIEFDFDMESFEIKSVDILESYVKAFPNPVSDILNMNISPDRVAQTKALLQNSARKTLSLSIMLYDSFGAKQRETTSAGENVSMSVAGLPNGLYFLHVYDGISTTPEIHKIIVRR